MSKTKNTVAFVTVVVGCVLAFASPAQSGNSSDDMIHLAPDVISEYDENDENPALGKLAYSKEFDQCAKAYYAGDKKRGEQLWKKLLNMASNATQIRSLVKNLHGRIVMVSSDERQPKCSGLCFYNSLLVATEQAMPANHRFIGDVLDYLANYYEDIKDFKSAIVYRERQVAIFSKTARKDRKTQDSIQNLAYDNYLIGNYKAARTAIATSISTSKSLKYSKQLNNALKLQHMIDAAIHRKQ